jgi:hypothetical protein
MILAEYQGAKIHAATLSAKCGMPTVHNITMACATGDYLGVIDSHDSAPRWRDLSAR